MNISDELRKWMDRTTIRFDDRRYLLGTDEELTAITDRIDAEHRKTIRELNNLADASVLLPVDADGEPIRAGDKVVWKNETFPRIVQSMTIYPEGLWTIIASGVRVDREKLRHYHAPTVEDVLRDFAQEMSENMGMYTGEAIDADEWRNADAKTVEKYAAKMREVMAE